MFASGVMPDGYKVFRKSAEVFLEAERLFLAQKAKCHYLQQGDRCTKFFHDLIKRNNKCNSIIALKTAYGSITTNEAVISDLFFHHFKSLMGSNVERVQVNQDILLSGSLVSPTQWDDLVAPVGMEEVHVALLDIDNDKASGPDGFGYLFFKSCWHIIGNDVFAAVQEFFISSRILRICNHYVITLVPKSADASSVGDYRPIS